MVSNTAEEDSHETERARRYAAEMKAYQASLLGGMRALETYTAERFVPNQRSQAALDAANNFNPKTDNIYIFGPTGCGKSHLAAIAARKEFTSPNGTVRTISQMAVSRELRGCKDGTAEQECIRRICAVRTLVLEDLGVAKDTEFLVAATYEIINTRYQDCAGGLIVTSNLSLGDIAEKFGDERVSSRLAQMCKVFNLAGERDRRVPERRS